MYATGCTKFTRCTFCQGYHFGRFHCAGNRKMITKLLVSTGSAGSTQTNLFNISGRSLEGNWVKSPWLKISFFYHHQRNFHVTKFNALSTLLTASLNLDPNRQEDNTSEIPKIKPTETRKPEINASENNETCGSLAATLCFSRTRWGVTLTQP